MPKFLNCLILLGIYWARNPLRFAKTAFDMLKLWCAILGLNQ